MFDAKTGEHEFDPQKLCQKKLSVSTYICNPYIGTVVRERELELGVQPLQLLGKLQASETPCLKKRRVGDI